MDYNALSAKELIELCLSGDTQAVSYVKELFTPQSDADYGNAIAFELATFICEDLLIKPEDFWDDKQEAFDAFFNSPYLGNYLLVGEQNDSPTALFGLAVLTCKNITQQTCADPQDAYQKLTDYLHRAMNLNHVGAHLLFANLMYDSKNEDHRLLGVKAAERAIELGSYDACHIPAYYYCFENVVPDKALKYAAICEKYNPTLANACFSEIYQTGMCGEKNLTKAAEYMERELDNDPKGDTLVCILDCYIEMDEEERSKIANFSEIAKKRVEQLLSTHNQNGWRILGIIYENGLFGYSKDVSLATKCYKKAYEANSEDTFSLNRYRNLTNVNNKNKPASNSTDVDKTTPSSPESEYENKKEKSVTIVSYIAIALAIVFRFIPWGFLTSAVYSLAETLESALLYRYCGILTGVFRYSYVTAIMLFSLLRVRRGKKGFIAGIILSALLGIADIEGGVFFSSGTFAICIDLIVLVFSIGLSLLLFFLFGKKASMRKSGWYLLCCFASAALLLGLLSSALLIAIALIAAIYAFAAHCLGLVCCSSTSSSTDDYTYSSYSSQARDFASEHDTNALYNENGTWYVTDSYGNKHNAEITHTGDIYNTYVRTSDGKSYVVPHSDVYSGEVYAATKIDDD